MVLILLVEGQQSNSDLFLGRRRSPFCFPRDGLSWTIFSPELGTQGPLILLTARLLVRGKMDALVRVTRRLALFPFNRLNVSIRGIVSMPVLKNTLITSLL